MQSNKCCIFIRCNASNSLITPQLKFVCWIKAPISETRHKKGSLQRKKIKKYLPIPQFVSLHLRYLHQDKLVPGKVLFKRYRRYSRTSIYRHMDLLIDGMPKDQRCYNEGRPSKLSSRSKRSLIREIPKVWSKTNGKFTLKDLRDSAAIPKEISNSTVSRVLYSNDYKSRPTLRKGVLTEQDSRVFTNKNALDINY